MAEIDQDRFDQIFSRLVPSGHRGYTPDEPDRPKTIAEYNERYPKLKASRIFNHFKEGSFSANEIAEWVGYDVRDFKGGELGKTSSGRDSPHKSPRSHVRALTEKLVALGFVEKDSSASPVTYSLTELGQQERQAILDEMAADSDAQ